MLKIEATKSFQLFTYREMEFHTKNDEEEKEEEDDNENKNNQKKEIAKKVSLFIFQLFVHIIILFSPEFLINI